jgi:hypothetical protein
MCMGESIFFCADLTPSNGVYENSKIHPTTRVTLRVSEAYAPVGGQGLIVNYPRLHIKRHSDDAVREIESIIAVNGVCAGYSLRCKVEGKT